VSQSDREERRCDPRPIAAERTHRDVTQKESFWTTRVHNSAPDPNQQPSPQVIPDETQELLVSAPQKTLTLVGLRAMEHVACSAASLAEEQLR
jgi:hypothetical protein